MKKTVMAGMLSLLFCGACQVSKVAEGDDVYAVPSEEREKARQIARAKEQALAEARAEYEQRQQQARKTSPDVATDDNSNNVYYSDPHYSADDYYDYQYASRINRFRYPMGLGYYDGYYTNLYTYNQNPANWGMSIYSNYWYGMPSGVYNSWSIGFGNSWGYNSCSPYSFYYDPFYSSYGGCSPYMGYGYGYGYPYYGYNSWGWGGPGWSYMNGYSNGYSSGYYNGLHNSGWGYFNSADPNSGYGHVVNAPRNSNGGDNTRGRDGGDVIRNGGAQRYIQEVADQQNSRPRFDAGDRVMRRTDENSNRPVYINGGQPARTSQQDNGGWQNNQRPGRQQSNDRIYQRREDNPQPSRREQPSINQGGINSGSDGGGRRSGGGDGGSPRNSGGNTRPR